MLTKNIIKPGQILLAFIFLLTQSAFCVPYPWSAWRYESTENLDPFPRAWNLPQEAAYPSLCIDGAFVHIVINAHNQSINSGHPPYRLIASVETTNKEHTRVTFHSITIDSSLGRNHVVLPVTVNNGARITGALLFPVSLELQYRKYSKVSSSNDKYLATSLWSDETLDLMPKKGEAIKMVIDIEIHKKGSSIRQKVGYDFMPLKEIGIRQCNTV